MYFLNYLKKQMSSGFGENLLVQDRETYLLTYNNLLQ